ncbi:PF13387 domain protein [Bacteriovorax sp. Seq25_V]|nr:PF13387 domain protein [Bacteriovorax sp. Seq25_V]
MPVLITIYFAQFVSASGQNDIYLSQIAGDIIERLPSKMSNYLRESNTKIVSKPLAPISHNFCKNTNVSTVFGMTKKGIVYINSNIFSLPKESFENCRYTDREHLLTSTLVHELAHVYDLKFRVSSMDEYVTLAYAEKRNIKHKSKKRILDVEKITLLNKNSSRSPDIYEHENIKENFAVNFEFYFLDEQYACHRPSKFDFFSRVLEEGRERKYKCYSEEITIPTSRGLETINISPDNVKGVSYLFSGEGDDIASSFGHAQLLLELCSNNNCSKTNKYTFSFVADIAGSTYSLYSGLTGKYQSKLRGTDYALTKIQYNVIELRDITEYPLKLNRTEKTRLLRFLLENFWEYQGNYKFITNNCSSELLRLFKYAFDDKNIYAQNIDTPKGITEFLLKFGRIDKRNITHISGDTVLSKGLRKLGIRMEAKNYIALKAQDREEFIINAKKENELFILLLAENIALLKASQDYFNILTKRNDLSVDLETVTFSDRRDKRRGYGIKKIDSSLNERPALGLDEIQELYEIALQQEPKSIEAVNAKDELDKTKQNHSTIINMLKNYQRSHR